jgi:transcriptional regulator with XRE-family HTH domain
MRHAVELAGGHETKKKPRERKDVSHYIRAWRDARGLSTAQLADKAGLSSSAISQLELGRSSYTQQSLEKIAKAIGVEPWQLLAHNPRSDFGEQFPEDLRPHLLRLVSDVQPCLVKALTDVWHLRSMPPR